MPEPLPSTLPESLNASPQISSAYSRILLLEEASHTDRDRVARTRKLIHARVLGYLIREGPSMQAKERVALEVISCQNGGEMDKLGEIYCSYYIRIFKKNKGPTPLWSSHPSRPDFETKKDMIKEMLCEAPQNHSDAKKNALVRDNFQCLVTGRYDMKSVEVNHELERELETSDMTTSSTQCAHIFPQSTNSNISGSNQGGAKHNYAASVWSIMHCFGYEDLPKALNGAGVHSLDNVMTLDPSIHTLFDNLGLWFEALEGQENTYTIRARRGYHLKSCKANPITFRSTHPGLPLPNPIYLRIHASCCRIAHLSGAGEYMDKTLEDLEEMRVLSKDGTSAHLLAFALQPYGQDIIASSFNPI